MSDAFDRLSSRALNVIYGRLGDDMVAPPVTVEKVREALLSGAIHYKQKTSNHPNRFKVRNLGRKVYLELCIWAGVKPDDEDSTRPIPSVNVAVKTALSILRASLDHVASGYGCNGDHDSMIVANAFDALGAELKDQEEKL